MMIGLVASLLWFIYRSTKANLSSLGRAPGTADVFSDISRHPDDVPVPGLLILRVNTPLFYANAQSVRDQVKSSGRRSRPHTGHFDNRPCRPRRVGRHQRRDAEEAGPGARATRSHHLPGRGALTGTRLCAPRGSPGRHLRRPPLSDGARGRRGVRGRKARATLTRDRICTILALSGRTSLIYAEIGCSAQNAADGAQVAPRATQHLTRGIDLE